VSVCGEIRPEQARRRLVHLEGRSERRARRVVAPAEDLDLPELALGLPDDDGVAVGVGRDGRGAVSRSSARVHPEGFARRHDRQEGPLLQMLDPSAWEMGFCT
jgi:hypothetical protein